MDNLLIRLEQAALQMDSFSLFIPALAAIIMGLFLWLGGSRYAGFVIGLLGASLGAFIGLIIAKWFETDTLITVAIATIFLALVAILLKNTVIILLATIIFAAICGSTYLSYVFHDYDFSTITSPDSSTTENADPNQRARDYIIENLPQLKSQLQLKQPPQLSPRKEVEH